MPKRLFRSRTNRMLGGVSGGLAEYFNTDVTVIRLLWVVVTLFYGSGVLAYLIAWLVIPQRSEGEERAAESKDGQNTNGTGAFYTQDTWDDRPIGGEQDLHVRNTRETSAHDVQKIGVKKEPDNGMNTAQEAGKHKACESDINKDENKDKNIKTNVSGKNKDNQFKINENTVQKDSRFERSMVNDNSRVVGIILVVVGTLFLLREFVPWFNFGNLWPLILVAVGVFMLIRGGK